jgi:hypothetical protein
MSNCQQTEIDFSQFPQDSLLELSYVSRATQDMGLLSLMNLLEEAVNRNRELGITGVLYFDSGVFGQILEGFPEKIATVWEYIRKDRRHGEIQVLSKVGIQDRNFSNWSMKFFGSEEISRYVPELKTLFEGSIDKLPEELLILMRSIATAQIEQDLGDASHP